MASHGTSDITPAWLNNSFFEKALNSQEKISVKVTESNISRATKLGENFGSDVYRAAVKLLKDGKEESKSFIIKVELKTQGMGEVVSEVNAFNREIKALTTVVPTVHTILEEALNEKFEPCTAKCYYTHSGPPASVIVLEDLKELGFRLAEQTTGLDLNHCLLIVRRVAQFHAATAVMHEKHPDIVKPFLSSCFSEETRLLLDKLFSGVIRKVAEEVESWPEYKKRFASKLHKIADQTPEILMECVKPEENEFKVLCHDDLWLNNMMFKYIDDDNQVADVRFVDFQLCHWTSPVIDLHYVLNTCMPVELMGNYNLLIEEYYKNLRDTFSVLGYENMKPTIKELSQHLNKRCDFGVILGIFSKFMLLSDPDRKPDISKIIKGEEFIQLSERCKEPIKKLLLIFEKRGWI